MFRRNQRRFQSNSMIAVIGAACALTAAHNVGAGEGNNRVLWRFQMDSLHGGQFVTVAPDGTVYASDLTKLYALSPNGDLLWVASGAGRRRPISLGADGTIYTAGNLIKAFNPDGSLKWEFGNQHPGFELLAGPNVGPDGNIYAVQDTLFSGGGGLGAFSLDPDGNLLWDHQGDGRTGSTEGSNSAIVFGTDRFFMGIKHTTGTPTLWSFGLGGDFLWNGGNRDRDLGSRNFPKLDPSGRIIVSWGQTAIQAVTPDGNVDWRSFHPQGINLPLMPGIDADGVIYTASYSFLQLWAINPDGSTRWAIRGSSGLLDSLNVPPDGSIILTGGATGFGQPGWVRAYDTADGTLLWQLDLPVEAGLNQYVCSPQPTFTPDSQTAYVTTCFLGGNVGSYVYAIDIRETPGSRRAELTDFAIIDGTLISGGLPEIASSDDTYLEVEARVTGEVAQPHLMRMRLGATTNVQNPSTIDLTLESHITDVEATVWLSLRNWDTRRWEQVDQFAVGMQDEIHQITVPNADRFVRARDGRIAVRIKKIVFFPFTLGGFHSLIDQVEIVVQ